MEPTKIDFEYLKQHMLWLADQIQAHSRAGDIDASERYLLELETILENLQRLIDGD